MEYQISVTFADSTSSAGFTISDIIGEDDWTCFNYWDDISEFMSQMISSGESLLREQFPDGHNFSLSEVNIEYIGDVEE